MEKPFWYKVNQHELSYAECYARYNDALFNDRETMSIFFLATLNHHDPYIDGIHVLNTLFNHRYMSNRALSYFYIYWLLKGGFNNESIFQDNNMGGSLNNLNITLPSDFDEGYLNECLAIILGSFFEIGIVIANTQPYTQDNEELRYSLEYLDKLSQNFTLFDKTIDKVYRLAQVHYHIIQIARFLKGECYPSILQPYRRDKTFVKSVIYNYWPSLLKLLNDEEPFNEWEIEQLLEAHQRLYEKGDVDFLFIYIYKFTQYFPNHPLTSKLTQYLEPSPKNDRIRTEQYLRTLNPNQRLYFIPHFIPISDYQMTLFLNEIEQNGFIKAITPYIKHSKETIQNHIRFCDSRLNNNVAFSTQNSIFLYPWYEVTYYAEGRNIYVFLRSELIQLRNNRQNPFTREILPDYLFEGLEELGEDHVSESLEEIWSRILRRAVDLQSTVD